jgi:hypothetical protein
MSVGSFNGARRASAMCLANQNGIEPLLGAVMRKAKTAPHFISVNRAA